MAKVTELLNQALVEVQSLEEAIHGQSPLEAKLRDQEASLKRVALELQVRLTDVENREAALTLREAKNAEREAVIETQKQALKDLQADLLKKGK